MAAAKRSILYQEEALPIDLVCEILVRLRVKTLKRIQCVCKSWHALISSPLFQKNHFDRATHQIFSVRTETEEGVCHRYNDELSLSFHLSTNNSTDGTIVSNFSRNVSFPQPHSYFQVIPIQSCLGLVCIGIVFQRMLICNPATEELITLPPVLDYIACFGFGYAASTQEFKVATLSDDCRLSVFTLGTTQWRPVAKAPYRVHVGCAPLVHSALHFLPIQYEYDYIAAFNLDTEEYTRNIPLPVDFSREENSLWHITELGGSLCLTLDSMGTEGRVEIWLLKDYYNIDWVKARTINLSKICAPNYYLSARPVGIIGRESILLDVKNSNKIELWCYDPRDKSLTWKLADHWWTSYVESFFSLATR